MTLVYLSLGSNIGDRKKYLSDAISQLEALDQTELLAVSSFYQTKAWGNTNQDDFFNCVVALRTSLDPYILLDLCQQIEINLERVRYEHWGPRTIDIDILFYGQLEIRTENLCIPHPYVYERAFVLVPLLEIAKHQSPMLVHKIEQACLTLDTTEIVRL